MYKIDTAKKMTDDTREGGGGGKGIQCVDTIRRKKILFKLIKLNTRKYKN